MSWVSAAAIYFVIWWLVLFTVLPFGVRNASETGEGVEEGNEPGAPIRHGLGWKMATTSVIAAGLFVVVYALLMSGMLAQIQLPFVPDVKV
jgi:predicted secreted protein